MDSSSQFPRLSRWEVLPRCQFHLPQTLLLETGLLACVIVVIVAQLTPQIIASIYPVRLHFRPFEAKFHAIAIAGSLQVDITLKCFTMWDLLISAQQIGQCLHQGFQSQV